MVVPMPFSLLDFLQALAAGVLVGSAYALMCIGLGIIFGSMRVINFAQGDFLMLGMYAAFYLTTGCGVSGISRALCRADRRRLSRRADRLRARLAVASLHRRRGSPAPALRRPRAPEPTARSSSTSGISLILQNGGLIVFGSTPTGIRTPLSRSSWEIGDMLLNQARCVSFLVAVGAGRRRCICFSATRGTARRCAPPPTTAQAAIYMGIDVDRAHRVAWSLGVGITAVAGGLVATLADRSSPISGSISSSSCMPGSCSAVSAAFSAPSGAGSLIGIVQQMSTLVLPYQLQNTAIFVVFLLIIFLRPQGMFGRLSERT